MSRILCLMAHEQRPASRRGMLARGERQLYGGEYVLRAEAWRSMWRHENSLKKINSSSA